MLKHDKCWFLFNNLQVSSQTDQASSSTQSKMSTVVLGVHSSQIFFYSEGPDSFIGPSGLLLKQVLTDKLFSEAACHCSVARLKMPPIVLLGCQISGKLLV